MLRLTEKQFLGTLLMATHKYVLLLGGSGSGKSANIIKFILGRALVAPYCKQILFRYEQNKARSHLWDGIFAKTLRGEFGNNYRLDPRFTLNKAEMSLTFANGSMIKVAGISDKGKDNLDKLLGDEYITVYFDEASEFAWRHFDQFKTRMREVAPILKTDGEKLNPLIVLSENPPRMSHFTYQSWFKGINPEDGKPIAEPEQYKALQMNPRDNPHLPDHYLKTLMALRGLRRKRFWEGEFMNDAEGALWMHEDIKWPPDTPEYTHPDFHKASVIGLDPAISSDEASNQTGIILLSEKTNGHIVVEEDLTGQYSPQEWAERVCRLSRANGLCPVVAEVNQGGDMVSRVIQSHDPGVSVRQVYADRSKAQRAIPVAQEYAQERVFHRRDFPRLIDQMLSMTDLEYTGTDSPDNLDALCHAVAYLRGWTRKTGAAKGSKQNYDVGWIDF